jgi:hypothetical protein
VHETRPGQHPLAEYPHWLSVETGLVALLAIANDRVQVPSRTLVLNRTWTGFSNRVNLYSPRVTSLFRMQILAQVSL